MIYCPVGNAKLQGLLTQLDLTGTRYNIALVSSPEDHSAHYLPICPPVNVLFGGYRTLHRYNVILPF